MRKAPSISTIQVDTMDSLSQLAPEAGPNTGLPSCFLHSVSQYPPERSAFVAMNPTRHMISMLWDRAFVGFGVRRVLIQQLVKADY
jgi:hypothetical protein